MMDHLHEIHELSERLKKSKQNLANLREQYRDKPELLSIYEPSTVRIINTLESHLKDLLVSNLGITVEASTEKHADIWVSIEGEEFQKGSGPIGQVGAFLTKLSNANKQAMALIKEKMGVDFKVADLPSLNLFATAPGSLKLGLKRSTVKIPEPKYQLDLFDEYKGPWELAMESVDEMNIVTEGFQLLVKAIASVQDDEVLDELMKSYDEKEVIKILHFAKELAPSARSPIEYVKFEGDSLGLRNNMIKTDKYTRKLITERAKKIDPNREYIEGVAFIDAADITHRTVIARPLKYDNKTHDEIRCTFLKPLNTEAFKNLFIKQEVFVSGYIVYDKNNEKLLRLEIDEISFSEEEEE
jgi:hypothetical protein